MDYTNIYNGDVARLLGANDRVLAMVPCRLAHGAENVARTARVIERRLSPLPGVVRRGAVDRHKHRAPRRARSVLERIIDQDWPWSRVDVDEKISGTSLAGFSDSRAVQFADATRARTNLFALVTSHRFAIVRRTAGGDFEIVVEAPRAEVVSAVRRGRPLQRGRVVLGFADRSQVAFECGILLTGQARRLVASLMPAPGFEER